MPGLTIARADSADVPGAVLCRPEVHQVASRRVKIAIAGCGWVALTDYFPALATPDLRDRVELVAVCDIAIDRARRSPRSTVPPRSGPITTRC
ncbi:MAG: hypothetical protein FJ033_02115 [Chloroflexi bacterium]|nr:hypothetical protein [Chloroflexota bacterium]